MWPITAGAQMASRGTDWSGMCEFLHANARPGDVIIGSDYYWPAMTWCMQQRTGIAVASPRRYSPDDLVAAGRPSWYIHIETTPIDPSLERLGYVEVARDAIERPGTQHRDIRTAFPFRLSEHGSRLFRGPPVPPPAAVRFQDEDGQEAGAGWPDHATVFGSARYVIALALATPGPRELRIEYLAGPGRITVLRADGVEVARLGEAVVDQWTEATVPVPDTTAAAITVEFSAAGSNPSAVSAISLAAAAGIPQ
jgi:hypothetical protein